MNYFEFNGSINLVEPFTVNIANLNGLPRDTQGQPYIPSSTLKGWLRFATYRCLIHMFKEQGQLFSIHDHYMLAKGCDTGNLIAKERATAIGGNIEVRQKNPLIDLYGRWGLASSLGVGSAIARKDNLIKLPSSSRSHISDRFDEFENYIMETEHDLFQTILMEDGSFSAEIRELKDKIKNLNMDKKGASGSIKENLDEQINNIYSEIEGIKNQKVGSKESIKRVNSGVEALDRGTQAQHRMKLNGNYQESFKLLIWTISKLPLFKLGGLSTYNFGKVEAEWEIYNHSFNHPTGTAIGKVGFNANGFILELDKEYQFDLKNFEQSLLDESKFNFRLFGG